jgi:hypothetical protein
MEYFKIQVLFSQYFSKSDFEDLEPTIKAALLDNLESPNPFLDIPNDTIEILIKDQKLFNVEIEDFENTWHRSYSFDAVVIVESSNTFFQYLEAEGCFDADNEEFLANDFAMRFIEGSNALVLIDDETGKDYLIEPSKARADGEVERIK